MNRLNFLKLVSLGASMLLVKSHYPTKVSYLSDLKNGEKFLFSGKDQRVWVKAGNPSIGLLAYSKVNDNCAFYIIDAPKTTEVIPLT